jgi:hypothetical protein
MGIFKIEGGIRLKEKSLHKEQKQALQILCAVLTPEKLQSTIFRY